MLNSLVVLYTLLFSNMGLAIIVLTALIRLITMPLTLKQLRQMRAMSALQPKLKEIQDRYARDRSRISQETMRLYREAGVNPIGCLGPMIIQMPVLIGLFRVLIQTVFSKPDDLVGLSKTVTLLLDAHDPVRRGGTGRVVNWTLAARLAARRRLFLAGGLRAENIAEAVRMVRPYGVDISSGVESQPGVKSKQLMRKFFSAMADV